MAQTESSPTQIRRQQPPSYKPQLSCFADYCRINNNHVGGNNSILVTLYRSPLRNRTNLPTLSLLTSQQELAGESKTALEGHALWLARSYAHTAHSQRTETCKRFCQNLRRSFDDTEDHRLPIPDVAVKSAMSRSDRQFKSVPD